MNRGQILSRVTQIISTYADVGENDARVAALEIMDDFDVQEF